MAPSARPFPPALPHGAIQEVLPGMHVVTGTVRLPGPLPVTFSRSMTVVQEGDRVVLVNSVRLDETGLAALDALGRVTDVIRLAANHGLDDPFYKDRYGAKVWAVRGQRYTPGFNTAAVDTYFTPDAEMDAATELPLGGARLFVIDSTPPEGILLLDRHDGTAISGDCLQNWQAADSHFSWTGKWMMTLMGFIRPYNIGPGWLRQGKPPVAQLRGILDLPFQNVFPGHGAVVLGDARGRFRPAIDRLG